MSGIEPDRAERGPRGPVRAGPDLDPHVEPCAYLTADVPAVGGRIKERPEDFIVEEIPLYGPSGEGEHIYLFVEKRNLPAMQMVGILARHFGVANRAVGYAGLKDKVAVTRQHITIHTPGRTLEDFPPFQHERITVLWADRHANKLRQGHLAGNRFIIRIRGVEVGKAVHAHRVLRRLERSGVPNRAGEQRFGHLLNNHLVGRMLVTGDWRGLLDELLGPSERFPRVQAGARRLYAEGRYAEALAEFPRSAHTERAVLRALARGATPEQAVGAIDEMQRRYLITALQSAVFNAVLDRRLQEGTFGALREGDIAWKHGNGALFRVDAPTLADPDTAARLERIAISPSGPMWGVDMMRAEGETDRLELDALGAAGVSLDDLRACGERFRDPIAGDRRPLRVPLSFPDVEGGADEHGVYIRCAFELPRGAFATVVMREVMKPELAPAAHDEPGPPPPDRE